MKGIASAICPNCKYCEGMVEDSFYICGVTHSDGGLYHLMGVEDELYCTAYEEEINMSNLKVEGKVSDICPKCKNCKGITRESNDVHVWLTEVECEDPYDGMVKTLDADSNVCCSMFEEKKEKEPCDKISPLQLKKSQKKLQNQIKNLQTTNEESYKREEKLEEKLKKANELADSWQKSYERLRDQFVHPIYNILYPDEPTLNTSFDINVTDLLNYVKDLKVYSEENGSMYKEIQEWREKCIARGKDIDHLLSENKKLDKKIGELESRKEECEKKYRDEISKLQNIVTEKDVEIKRLKKEIINLGFDRVTVKSMAEKNNKLNQTISDQEITIKALLITIKEMCKED